MAGYLRIIYSFSGDNRGNRGISGSNRGKSLEDMQGIRDNRGKDQRGSYMIFVTKRGKEEYQEEGKEEACAHAFSRVRVL